MFHVFTFYFLSLGADFSQNYYPGKNGSYQVIGKENGSEALSNIVLRWRHVLLPYYGFW